LARVEQNNTLSEAENARILESMSYKYPECYSVTRDSRDEENGPENAC
jgi:hypothetical protein